MPHFVRNNESQRALVVGEAPHEARVDDDFPSGQSAGVDLVVVHDDDLPGDILQVISEAPSPIPSDRGSDNRCTEPRTPLHLRGRVGQPAFGGQQASKGRLPEGTLDRFGDEHGVFPSGKRNLLPRVPAEEAEDEDGSSRGEEDEARVHFFVVVVNKVEVEVGEG